MIRPVSIRQAVCGGALALGLSLLPGMAFPQTSAAVTDETLGFQLTERVRLATVQSRIQAQRTLMQWVRDQAVRIANTKQELERKQLRKAFDELVKTMRGKGSERRRKLIDEMQTFVQRYADTQASGDLLLRLAELYYEEANFQYILAMDEYERQYIAFEKGEADNPPEQPEPDYGPALELYREFTEAYKNHRYYRDGLYLYAYLLEESGFEDQAVEIYERLLETDPDGPLAPEVSFRVGQYYFLTGDLDLAAERYRHTLKLRDQTFYDKALYKLAWTYYRMDDLDRALLGFVELIDYGEKVPVGAEMRSESLQYMAIIFSDRGGLKDLEAFFAQIGPRSYKLEVIERLADLYFETADYRNALTVYRDLLDLQPYAATAPVLVRKIEDSWTKLENERQVVESWREFAERFGNGTTWQTRWKEADPRLAWDVQKEAEKKGFDYAAWWHGKGQATSDPAKRKQYYLRALKAYEAFEKQFDDSVRLAEAVFNQAEIHYDLGNWNKAGELYARVPEIAVDPTNELFSESAWNMILARRKALEVWERTPKAQAMLKAIAAERAKLEATAEKAQKEGSLARATRSVTGPAATTAATPTTAVAPQAPVEAPTRKRVGADGKTVKKKRTLPKAAMNLIRASLYYVRLYPLGERSPAVYYNTGDILMTYGLYGQARKQYISFVERFPDNAFVLDAIKQVVRTFLLEQKFGDLVEWGYSIYESPLANNPEIRDYFTTILSGAMFKDAQQLEKDEKLREAADAYLTLVDRFPESEFVDEALINAAAALQRQGDWERSTQVFLRFYEQFPDHPFASEALFQTAWNAERVLDFNAAVSRYTELLDRFPKHQKTKDALFNSANILAKLGQSRRAAELFLLYIERFPNEPDEADNIFFAARAYYDDGDLEKAEQLFNRYIKHKKRTEREVEALWYLSQIALERNDAKGYDKLLDRILEAYKRYTAEGKIVDPRFAAEAAFRKAEKVDRAYRNIKLRLPMDRMAKLLEQKAASLKKAVETWTGVVQYKDPYWSSAALHMIGEAYQHFADTLFEAPVPPDLDEEEAEFYKMELEDQAFPIEEKAMQGWQKNLELAVRLGIDNEWVEKSRNKLLELYPDVARVKGKERQLLADNEFFYRFPASSEGGDKLKFDGPRVVYLQTPYRIENLEQRYAITLGWTDRQKRVLFNVSVPAPAVLEDGQIVELDGIRDLWKKHFQ
ncbi:MAG: hypothetical protein D6761_04825 [Candidatus Dadabacteria bacterium]|nr:MAG: hypothetical protein D6761_04825 [Candidatus Dadabacteria bacterium]